MFKKDKIRPKWYKYRVQQYLTELGLNYAIFDPGSSLTKLVLMGKMKLKQDFVKTVKLTQKTLRKT
jgi:hypothetical protein